MWDNFVHRYYSRQDWSRLKSESQSVLFQQVRCRTPNHSSTFKSDVVQMVNRALSFITSLVKSVYYIIIYMWWGVDCGAFVITPGVLKHGELGLLWCDV